MQREADMAKRELKVITLIEPDLCLECRFSELFDAESEDGTVSEKILCKRGDCDNWGTRPEDSTKTVRIAGREPNRRL